LSLESVSLNLVLERTRLNYARGLIVPKSRLAGRNVRGGGVTEPVKTLIAHQAALMPSTHSASSRAMRSGLTAQKMLAFGPSPNISGCR
jgi:hypothetical protein